MPGLWTRVKTWISGETLTHTDLNAEFDNVISNQEPSVFDDYSASVAQMKLTTDPYPSDVESQATTLAGEIERLRFMLKAITGESQWYHDPNSTIAAMDSSLDSLGISAPSRIESGAVRTDSDQPAFLLPKVSTQKVTLKGATTSFVYWIDGVQYTVSSDVDSSDLSLSGDPTDTANQCLVNDATLTEQQSSQTDGEDDEAMTVDTMGANVSSQVGSFRPFRVNRVSDSAKEYFWGYVKSTTSLTRCYRGFFFKDTGAPAQSTGASRLGIANNDVIAIMKRHWIFVNTAGALEILSDDDPFVDARTPSGSNGDYWFDLVNMKWMRHNGSSFVAADATLIGVAITDNAGCVGARGFDFSRFYQDQMGGELDRHSATVVKLREINAQISVYGQVVDSQNQVLQWDIATDLESGISEAASTIYYLYINQDGKEFISDVAPYNRVKDLRGWYHPHHAWRCMGQITNDGSSNFRNHAIMTTKNYKIKADDLDRDRPKTTDGSDPGTGGLVLVASTDGNTGANNPLTFATVNLTTTGRPVWVGLTGNGTNTVQIFQGPGTTTAEGRFIVNRSVDGAASAVVMKTTFEIDMNGAAADNIDRVAWPVGSFQFLDVDCPAGLIQYVLQIEVDAAGNDISVSGNPRAFALEIGV